MPSLLRSSIFSLLAGVALSWLVALGPCLSAGYDGYGTSRVFGYRSPTEDWLIHVLEFPASDRLTAIHLSTAQHAALREPIPSPPNTTYEQPFADVATLAASPDPICTQVSAVRAGWPCRAFAASATQTWSSSPSFPLNPISTPTVSGGIAVGDNDILTRQLPLLAWRPLWPGLLANSLAYGAPIWVLWLALAAAWGRAFAPPRHLCAGCGHKLLRQHRCPECGKESRAVE